MSCVAIDVQVVEVGSGALAAAGVAPPASKSRSRTADEIRDSLLRPRWDLLDRAASRFLTYRATGVPGRPQVSKGLSYFDLGSSFQPFAILSVLGNCPLLVTYRAHRALNRPRYRSLASLDVRQLDP